jgi:hypothetical protein
LEGSRPDSVEFFGAAGGKLAWWTAATLSCIHPQNASVATGGKKYCKGIVEGSMVKVAVIPVHFPCAQWLVPRSYPNFIWQNFRVSIPGIRQDWDIKCIGSNCRTDCVLD